MFFFPPKKPLKENKLGTAVKPNFFPFLIGLTLAFQSDAPERTGSLSRYTRQ